MIEGITNQEILLAMIVALVWLGSIAMILQSVRDGTFDITDEAGRLVQVVSWVVLLALAPLAVIAGTLLWLMAPRR